MTTIRMRKGTKPTKSNAKSYLEIPPSKTLTAAYWTLLPMLLICFIKSTMTYVIKSHVMINLVEMYPSVLHIAGAWTFWTCSMDLFLRVPVQASLRLLSPLATYLTLGMVRMAVAGIALWQFAELRAAVVGVAAPGSRPEVFHLTLVMALIALETLLVKCSIDRFKLDWINTTAVLCDKSVDLDDYDAMVSMTRTLGAAVSITWTMKHESILAPVASPVNRTYAFIGINLSLCMFQMLLAIYVNWANPYILRIYEHINRNRGDVPFLRDVSSRVKKEFHQIFFCYLKKKGRKTIMVKRMFLTMTENLILNDFSWVFLVGVCKKHMDTVSSYLNLMSGLEYFSSTMLLPPKQTTEGHQKTLSRWLMVMMAAYVCVAVAIWLPMPHHQVAVAAYGGTPSVLNATVTAVTTSPNAAVTAATTALNATVAAVPTTPNPTMTAVLNALNATVVAATTTPNATNSATTTAPNATVTATTTAPNATVTATTTAPNARVTATTIAPNATVTATTTAPNARLTATTTAPNATVTATTTASNATVTATTTAPNATVTATTTASNATVTATTTASNATVTATTTAPNATVTATTTASNATVTATTTAPNATVTSTTTAPNATVTVTTTAPNATVTATTTAPNATLTATTTAPNATLTATTTAPNVPVIAVVSAKNKFGWKTGLFYAGMITVAMTVPHVKGLSSFLSETGPVTDDFEDGQLLSYVVADLAAGIVGSSVTFALNSVEYYKWILSCSLVLTVLGLSSWFLLWLPRSLLSRLGVVKNNLYDQ